MKVWDIFIRLFHWLLVTAFITQLATAESLKNVHLMVGFFIIGLLVLRIIWGFVGTKHARFMNFIYPPSEILSYLGGLIKGHPKHYVGHNPAGGAMVCVLLLVLTLTTLTGVLTYSTANQSRIALFSAHSIAPALADSDHRDLDHNDEDHRHNHTNRYDHFWKEIHETLVGILIFLIVLHIGGVAVSSWVHRENLISAMITGIKKS